MIVRVADHDRAAEALAGLDLTVVEKNIKLVGADALSEQGFVQIPVAIVRNSEIPLGAKMVYTALLSYAWHNDSVFPGQQRLARDAGTARQTVNKYIQELVQAGLVSIKHRGQGNTAIYTLHVSVKHGRVSQ